MLNIFQAHKEQDIGYNSYLRKIRKLALEGVSEAGDQIKIIAVEMNIFGDNTFSDDNTKNDNIVIVNKAEKVTVKYQQSEAMFDINSEEGLKWL